MHPQRGHLAPTAASRQPIQLIVLHTSGREAVLGLMYRRTWFVRAPLMIAVCAISSQAWVRESDHRILAATNLGLGTYWRAAFNVEAACSVLGLPAQVEPVDFTPLGYTADLPGPKIRKPWADLVRYEHW